MIDCFTNYNMKNNHIEFKQNMYRTTGSFVIVTDNDS